MIDNKVQYGFLLFFVVILACLRIIVSLSLSLSLYLSLLCNVFDLLIVATGSQSIVICLINQRRVNEHHKYNIEMYR